MKILSAIVSNKNSKVMVDNTLAWAGRAGYNMRIFIPDKRQLNKYYKAIDDSNYHHYLSIPYSIIVTGVRPRIYALLEGYDLLVTLPDNLPRWGRRSSDINRTVLDYARAVGIARLSFSVNPKKKKHTFPNGAVMERVKP